MQHLPSISLPPWQGLARCRTLDPSLFFPDDGCSALGALAECVACPVVVACARWAVELRHTDVTIGDVGVWGATTPTTRKQIRRGELTVDIAIAQARARVLAAEPECRDTA